MLNIVNIKWNMSEAFVRSYTSNLTSPRQPKVHEMFLDGNEYEVVAEGYFGFIAAFANRWEELGVPGDRIVAKTYNRAAFYPPSVNLDLPATTLSMHVLSDLATLRYCFNGRPSCWASGMVHGARNDTPCVLVADSATKAIELPRSVRKLDHTPAAAPLYKLAKVFAGTFRVDPFALEDLEQEALSLSVKLYVAASRTPDDSPRETAKGNRAADDFERIYSRACGLIAKELGVESAHVAQLGAWAASNEQTLNIVLEQSDASGDLQNAEFYHAVSTLASIYRIANLPLTGM